MKPLVKRALYVWQARYPWDVRVEKIISALKRGGVTVELLARRAPGEPALGETFDGIPIHRVGPERPRVLSLPIPGNLIWERAIEERVHELKPQILIARDIPLAIPTAKVGRRHGIPMVIDMAEQYPVAMRTWKKYQSRAGWRLLVNHLKLPDRIERASVRASAGIMPVCEEQKQRLMRDYGCRNEMIVPVLNTPSLTKIPSVDLSQAKRKGGLFGYHGVVIQDRDLLTVIRGFDLAASRNPDVRLVIAGDGESMGDVKSEADRSRHRQRIQFSGRFKHDELERLYSEVDFGVVSWKLNEFTHATIANKFFDYAAYGKPVLYARTRAMESLMKDMKFGVGYAGDDPESVARGMLELMDANYGELARNGRASVEREFNWEKDVEKMMGFLERVAEARA